jgi:hypothetical protein
MCIVCECGEVGLDFLSKFEKSRYEMKEAKAAMLKCVESTADKEVKKCYSVIHKKMVKLLKEWNRLEELRSHNA